MSVAIGLLLALNIGLCASLLPERWLRLLFAGLSALSLVWLIQQHIARPGFELATLWVLGLSLSGVFSGAGVAVLALPLAALIPLSLAGDANVALAVHNHWHTAGTIVLAMGVGAALRQAWLVAHEGAPTWGRPALLSVLLASPLTFILGATPSVGARAGNLLLPMQSVDGLEARMVVLDANGASSWPWLEAIEFGSVIAVALIGFSALLFFAARPDRPRHRLLLSFFALAVMVTWGFVTVASPGSLGPLTDVDPQKVVDALRPGFVPAEATVYLTPERDEWKMSIAALSLWFGVGAWVATSALLAVRPTQAPAQLQREPAALAPALLLGGGLLLAEAWSQQAMSASADGGGYGLVFAIAAAVAAASSLRGRARLGAWLIVAACIAAWSMSLIAGRVVA